MLDIVIVNDYVSIEDDKNTWKEKGQDAYHRWSPKP